MATAIRTQETERVKIEVTLWREVIDKIGDADGYKIDLGREVHESYDVRLTGKATGKVITAYGKADQLFYKAMSGGYRIGNAIVNQDMRDLVMGMVAELDAEISKTEEQVKIETAEAARIAAIDAAEDEPAHGDNGYCRKCHSYCYGDCEA